jgi:hypothetical protein
VHRRFRSLLPYDGNMDDAVPIHDLRSLVTSEDMEANSCRNLQLIQEPHDEAAGGCWSLKEGR